MKNRTNGDNYTTNIYRVFGFVTMFSNLAAGMIVGSWFGAFLVVLGIAAAMIMEDAVSKIGSYRRLAERLEEQ